VEQAQEIPVVPAELLHLATHGFRPGHRHQGHRIPGRRHESGSADAIARRCSRRKPTSPTTETAGQVDKWQHSTDAFARSALIAPQSPRGHKAVRAFRTPATAPSTLRNCPRPVSGRATPPMRRQRRKRNEMLSRKAVKIMAKAMKGADEDGWTNLAGVGSTTRRGRARSVRPTRRAESLTLRANAAGGGGRRSPTTPSR